MGLPALQYHLVEGWDADHWFHLPLNNDNLFETLTLRGIPELLPGKLFSTRMPRNQESDPASKTAFAEKVKKNKLAAVVILTEPEEYQEYAGTDFEAFYRSLGLEVICRPIKDFSVPGLTTMMDDILDVLINLTEDRNTLVHCAGGNGRTGLVICGVARACGIADPIKWCRQVKSTYIETPEQEDLVQTLPIGMNLKLTRENPRLFEAAACEQLIHHIVSGTDPSTLIAVKGLSKEQIEGYKAVFNLFDADRDGTMNHLECFNVFKELGVLPSFLHQMDKDYFKITENDFLKLMETPVKNTMTVEELFMDVGDDLSFDSQPGAIYHACKAVQDKYEELVAGTGQSKHVLLILFCFFV